MDEINSIFAHFENNYSVTESENVIRVFDLPNNSTTYDSVRKLKTAFSNQINITLLDDMDQEVEFEMTDSNFIESNTLTLKITKILVFYPFYLTKTGFNEFLKNGSLSGSIAAVNVPFLENPFSSNHFRFTKEFEVVQKHEFEKIETIKYVKALNSESQNFIPDDINAWITIEKDINNASKYWQIESTKRLICSLSSEIFQQSDNLELYFRGERRKKLIVNLSDLSHLATIFKNTTRCSNWIYGESKDIDTRHGIFNHQISLILPENLDKINISSILNSALDNSKLAYRYYLQSSNKELNKTLTELNKTLFDYITKIRQNTNDLMTSAWRDLSTVLGLMLLNFSLKKPDLPNNIYEYLSVALCIYLSISIILTGRVSFWYFKNLFNSLQEWRTKIYGYLSDDEFEKFARKPMLEANSKFTSTYIFISILYFLMILFIILFSFSLIEPLLEILKTLYTIRILWF